MGLGNRFLRRGFSFRTSFPTVLAALTVLVILSLPIHDWVSIVVIPFGFLIYELADPQNALGVLFSNHAMLLLGGASYSIYLLQLPFRECIRALSVRVSYSVASLATPATPALLVLFSIFVFKFWEEPMRRVIRRGFGAMRVSN
jgi:peptidoglycan/LPS O-acetylase OafA/YrhL